MSYYKLLKKKIVPVMEMTVQIKMCIDQARSCYGNTGTKAVADWNILKHSNSISQVFGFFPPHLFD